MKDISNLKFIREVNIIFTITNDSVQPEIGIWYNLAATYSESNQRLKLYVNGSLVSEEIVDNPSIKTATNYNYMCRGQNGDYLNGTIDQISIWNRELTYNEIMYVFNKPKVSAIVTNFSDQMMV